MLVPRALALVIAAAGLASACARASSGEQPQDAPPDQQQPPLDAAVDSAPDAFACAMMPCSILPQCGCAGSMPACDVDGSDFMGTACRQVSTPGTETSRCSFLNQCAAGYICVGGSCKKYCDADAACGTPRGLCAITINSGGMPIADIPKVCSSNCDPTNVAAGGCPSGDKCGLFTTTVNGVETNIVDCARAGTGTQGVSCTQNGMGNDQLCAPDHLCTSVQAGVFNCRKVCNRTANTGCTGGLTCIAFNPAYTIAGTEYGVCN